jgi:hypothetical protein
MLFVLVMECFHALFRKADSLGLLQQLGRHAIRFRASLYADDVVAFFSPVELDLRVVKGVIALFEEASGLAANLSKSDVYPINCSDEQISLVRSILSCSITEFPCTYLGVPLFIKRIPKAAFQPLVDKVARRLPPWQGRLLNCAGRLVLAKSTLSAIPVHISMAISVAPWAIKAVETLIQGFLWCGTEVASGGRCQVAWVNVTCPTRFGGLGLPNLRTFGMALRLRWLWLARTDPDKTWALFHFRTDRSA